MKAGRTILWLGLWPTLTGCAAITEPFGIEDPFAIERPFQATDKNEAILNPSLDLATIVVETPRGLKGELATALRDRVIAVLQARDVAAMTQSSLPSWNLRGKAANVMAGSGRHVVVWRLYDANRVQRGQFSIVFLGDNAGTVEPRLSVLAEQIADRTGQFFGPALSSGQAVAQANEKPVVWIGAIEGAPGDGNAALTTALQTALPMKGMLVDAVKANAAWRVECKVEVSQKSAAEDLVVLRWRLLDSTGQEVSVLAQENRVARGRLNKPWRELAGFAAEAAAGGIRQIIQQVTKAKKG